MAKSENVSTSVEFQVAAFYCFKYLDDENLNVLLNNAVSLAEKYNVRGMVLFAPEGINGTICGTKESISYLMKTIEANYGSESLEIKYSTCKKQAFRRFRVRRKSEIVTMGIDDIKPSELGGNYIEPHEWNSYLDDPNTLVIDTRNDYEIAVGSFKGALNPRTETFREFPKWVNTTLKSLVETKKPQNIAMFCTGGIRCEKATSYLIKEGFKGVSQLHGGILRYLQDVPQDENRWNGECFVFDRRVALDHQLSPGSHRLCNACGMPLSPEDCRKSSYVRGIRCHYCEDRFSDIDRKRFADRQKHIDELIKKSPDSTLWPNP
tara:strand:+ start:24248 stop:25210 length:963 start_codon:yes stop_codon:yes gene_type:complete